MDVSIKLALIGFVLGALLWGVPFFLWLNWLKRHPNYELFKQTHALRYTWWLWIIAMFGVTYLVTMVVYNFRDKLM